SDGPGLPTVAFLARLPAGLLPSGTLVTVTALAGIGRAGVVAGALWAGQAAGGPLIGATADPRGRLAGAYGFTASFWLSCTAAWLAAGVALALVRGHR